MTRFGMSEYIRNFWYNLCIILIMLVMMITSTALISNIDKETRVYRMAQQLLDEDTLFLTTAYSDFKDEIDSMNAEVHIAETFEGCYDTNPNIPSNIRATVYTEEVMDILTPRLESGVYPDQVQTDDDTICVLMSENPYGIDVGDTFTFYAYTMETDSYIQVKVYVAGIISEGQNLYTDLSELFEEMLYEDLFPVYSYEQTEVVRMIVPEEEMKKIPEVKEYSYYTNVMINPSEELSMYEKDLLQTKLFEYEMSSYAMTSTSIYPDTMDLIDRSEIKHKSTRLKYVPLFVIIVVLFSICIVGIITIKTVKSTRYYGIMYACGMQYHTAQFLAGLEMGFNCIVAFLGTVSLLTLQNALAIVGEINCNLDTLELLVMAGICIVTVISSVLTTRSVLKQQTPVEILKNRV